MVRTVAIGLSILALTGCDDTGAVPPSKPIVHHRSEPSGPKWFAVEALGVGVIGMRDDNRLLFAVAIPSGVNSAAVPSPDSFSKSVSHMGSCPLLMPYDGSRMIYYNDKQIPIPENQQLFAFDYDGSLYPIDASPEQLEPLRNAMVQRSNIPIAVDFSPLAQLIFEKVKECEQRQKQKSLAIMQQQREKEKVK